jgi:hypothetical protein
MNVQLIHYDAMLHSIQQANQVDEVKEIRDRALALQAYMRQARNHEAERKVTEIRLRAERRTGQLLREQAAKSERPKGRPEKDSEAPRLSDLGISFDQSSQWQKLAPDPWRARLYEAASRGLFQALRTAGSGAGPLVFPPRPDEAPALDELMGCLIAGRRLDGRKDATGNG